MEGQDAGLSAATRELIDRFTQHQQRRGLTERTIYQRRTNLRTFGRWIEPEPLLGVDQAAVEAFVDSRRTKQGAPITAKTRYGWLSTLCTFYTWAAKQGMVETDPTTGIDRPKLRRNLPRPISETDLAVALAYADPMMHAWLMLMAFCGLPLLRGGPTPT